MADPGESKTAAVVMAVGGIGAMVLFMLGKLSAGREAGMFFAAGMGLFLVLLIVGSFRATQRDSRRGE